MTIAKLSQRVVPPMGEPLHFLDGKVCEGRGEALEVTFPATSEPLCSVRGADEEQVEQAVSSAKKSFEQGVWRHLPSQQRAEVLERAASLLLKRQDEIVERVLYDNSKTREEAIVDVLASAGSLTRSAEHARGDQQRVLGRERGVDKLVMREPVGVVLGLTPYNAPLMFAGLKAAPALAAGNSVVLKVSPRAPLVPIVLCEALAEAGLPRGVLSLLHGGVDVASRVAGHADVAMISLTGGTVAGTAVMRQASSNIKNLLLELGGKSAHIVLEDADLERAIPAVAAGIFRNSGQRCFSGSRLVVHESVADQVEQGVASIARRLVLGDPFSSATQVGPMIDLQALSGVADYVAKAEAEGLQVMAGGQRREDLGPGAFFAPTLLTGASSKSWASQTEIFGPVLTSIRVTDEEEAIAVANDSPYGLAGAVWTGSEARALKIAKAVRAGYFWVNTYGAVFGDAPFGGYGRSGLGREAGVEGYNAYTEQKSILIDRQGGASAPIFRMEPAVDVNGSDRQRTQEDQG